MGWAVAIFGGVFVYAGFDDYDAARLHPPVPWGSERLTGVIVGTVLILAGMAYNAFRR